MNPFLQLLALATLALSFSGCANCDFPEEDSGYSDLPTVTPAEWKYRRDGFGQP